MPAETAEEDAAEGEQAESLPEGEFVPAEERWHEPVPEMQNDFAADEGEEEHSQNRQRSNKHYFEQFSSHVASLRFRKIVVNTLQPLAEMENRVAFAR